MPIGLRAAARSFSSSACARQNLKSKANELQSNQDFLGFFVARGDAGRGHFEFSLASDDFFGLRFQLWRPDHGDIW